ncbi:hypothetical protein VTK56DRAFT_1652 [Thermocarpiscus australiensis]
MWPSAMEDERTITLNLGSSPDPLIDPALSPPMMPPSHIKTRSPAAQRLHTIAQSPRKRTFELDVGNELSPQRILVTVEAENEAKRSTSRRLFQSPTPKRRLIPRTEKTVTTTTVPLRGLTDDEATPKQSRRPRKSVTPLSTRRKRPGTPARRRKSGAHAIDPSPRNDTLGSSHVEGSQRPGSQPRRGAKRKSISPVKDGDVPGTQPRKRGRPRKQPTISDDLTARLEQGTATNAEAGHNASIARGHADISFATKDRAGDDMEEDIWLATLSDQPTPAPSRRHPGQDSEQLARDQHSPEPPQPEPLQPRSEYQHQYDWPDMGGGMDSYSETESQAGDNPEDQDRQDTVMAGEEFTMISLGSLPSMQPNSSVMAPEHEEFGEATSLIINNALESLRQSQNKSAQETAAQQTAAAAAEAEQSAEEVVHDRPVQQLEPLFSPRPPSRSPQPSSQSNQSPRRTKAQPLAKQLARKTLQQGDGLSPAPRQPATDDAQPQDVSAYEDSFSEIPEAVLAAATPRRFRRPQMRVDETADGHIQPSIERPSTTPSPIPTDNEGNNPHAKSPRPALDLDMPSSPPVRSPNVQQRSNSSTAHHIRANSTETPAEQLSSLASTAPVPEVAAQPVHLLPPEPQPRPSLSPIVRAGRALQLITSDPPSPPGRDSVLGSPFRGSVARSSKSPAPASAPVPPPARATRSPSQPRAGAVAESPQRSWLAPLSQIKDFVVRSAQSLSPARVSFSGTERMEDPFGPDPTGSTGQASVRNTLFSGPSKQGHYQDAAVNAAGSTGANSVHDDDAMSWRGDSGPAGGSQRSASTSPTHSAAARASFGDNEDQSRNHEELRKEPEPRMSAEAPRPHASTAGHVEDYDEEEEDDDDIWAIEAQRPTPFAPKNAPPRQEPVLDPPLRGRISSPWRQNSRRSVYNEEFQRHSDRNASFAKNPALNEEEEPSLLAQKRDERAPAPANPPPTKKPDLSAFFSSPATLPDLQEIPGLDLSKALDSRRPERVSAIAPKSRALPAIERPQPSGNSLFSHYLQQQTQTQRSSDLRKQFQSEILQTDGEPSSSVRDTSLREASVRDTSERDTSVRDTSERDASVRDASVLDASLRDTFVRDISEQSGTGNAAAPIPRPVSPELREEAGPAHIPQKMHFTPRQRRSGSTLFQPRATNSLFGNSQAFFPPSQQQIQQQGGPLEEDYEEEETSFVAPPLKPLPDRTASPGKSSMRSPLKPKTPGRVVEFTSSTLSPLAQAQARTETRVSMSQEIDARSRDERRDSIISSSSQSGSAAENDRDNSSEEPPEPETHPPPHPGPAQRPPPARTTHPLTSSLTRPPTLPTANQSNPTATTAAPAKPQPLSRTTWTRAHWLRLDELLQARKQGILPLQLELARRQATATPSPARATTTTTTTSASSPKSAATGASASARQHLLGKLVTAQGASMALEGWHLDVVEAFRAEVERDGVGGGGGGGGGTRSRCAWDEAQIAKRVFALLVGEERRRLGLVPARR